MRKVIWLLALLLALTGCSAQTAPVENSNTTEPPETTEAPKKARVVPTVPTRETEPVVSYPTVVDTYIRPPMQFTVQYATEDRMVYQSPNAPEDSSSIVVQVGPQEDVLSFTEEDFTAYVADQANGDSVQLEAMTHTTVDDLEALYGVYTMTVSGEPCRCESYLIPANNTYSFTFLDYTEAGDWTEAFATAQKSIALLQEGEWVHPDYTGLERYDLGCGMELYAMPGMEAQDLTGFDASLIGGKVVALVFSETKEQVGEGFSIEEYAKAVTDANGLTSCTRDQFGNLATSFTQTDGQDEMYYYLTIKETADAFWICQLACPEVDAPTYEAEFRLWSTSLEIIG